MARSLELDLVEVADKANPPVCRIMDYGKYKYEASQKAKESRKKATHVVVKEMKYRPKIGPGDFSTKTRHVEKFLDEGHKVKVTIMFRGREMQHPELGRKILDQVAVAVNEVGLVEIYPRQDGRNMVMVLAPVKRKPVRPPREDGQPAADDHEDGQSAADDHEDGQSAAENHEGSQTGAADAPADESAVDTSGESVEEAQST